MERIVFCLIVALLSVGCVTNAQIQGNNSNLSRNSTGANVPSNNDVSSDDLPGGNRASQTKLYKICGNPNVQCKSNDVFSESELSFELTGEMEFFGEYLSKPFYAVILKSRKVIEGSFPADKIQQDCGGQFTEDERLETQKLFPENKVFATKFGCFRGYHQGYTKVNFDFNFMAVYGGERITQANALLKKVRDSGKFSGANIRKIQAGYCHGCH